MMCCVANIALYGFGAYYLHHVIPNPNNTQKHACFCCIVRANGMVSPDRLSDSQHRGFEEEEAVRGVRHPCLSSTIPARGCRCWRRVDRLLGGSRAERLLLLLLPPHTLCNARPLSSLCVVSTRPLAADLTACRPSTTCR